VKVPVIEYLKQQKAPAFSGEKRQGKLDGRTRTADRNIKINSPQREGLPELDAEEVPPSGKSSIVPWKLLLSGTIQNSRHPSAPSSMLLRAVTLPEFDTSQAASGGALSAILTGSEN
jgi:hypothetical protein